MLIFSLALVSDLAMITRNISCKVLLRFRLIPTTLPHDEVIMFNSMIEFFISEWFWMITFGIYHIPYSIIFMTLLLKFWARMKMIKAFLLSASATLFAFTTYTLFAVGILIMLVGFTYNHPERISIQPFVISLSLAAIYSILEILFFWIVRKRYKLNMVRLSIIVVISNMLAATTFYFMLPQF